MLTRADIHSFLENNGIAHGLGDATEMLWERADYDLCATAREIPKKYYL